MENVVTALGEANTGQLDFSSSSPRSGFSLAIYGNPLLYTISGEIAVLNGFEEAS